MWRDRSGRRRRRREGRGRRGHELDWRGGRRRGRRGRPPAPRPRRRPPPRPRRRPRRAGRHVVPYFRDRLDYDREETARFRAEPELPGQLARLRDRYAAAEPFAVETLERELRALADELGVKAAHLIHPLRMALSASKAGPPVFDLTAAMGREATRRHLDHFVAHLQAGE